MLEKMRRPPLLPSSLDHESDSAITEESDPLVTSPAPRQHIAMETEELRKKGGSPGGGTELRPRRSERKEESGLLFFFVFD